MEEDFELMWQEKAEEHVLGAEQMFYNSLLMQSGQDGAVAQQEFLSRLAELNKEKQLIKIKYKKISDLNRIKRREEKRKFKVDEGRPTCKPPFRTNCTAEKQSHQS